MTSTPYDYDGPELVFGLVAPIGCDIDRVEKALMASLRQVKYHPQHIVLSERFESLYHAKTGTSEKPTTIKAKIDLGNKICESFNNKAILAAEAIKLIKERRELLLHKPKSGTKDLRMFAPRVAYIVRQIKREAEVELLREVYGKQFILVSITESLPQRIDRLKKRVKNETRHTRDLDVDNQVFELVETDRKDPHAFGQDTSAIFHLGDVFIDSDAPKKTKRQILRFIEAFFGKNDIGPTRDEYGTYLAHSAALRSIDVSRQVGAAITTSECDIISLGCNEVPKPGGGNYWDDDEKTNRDVDLDHESNRHETQRIIKDFLAVLKESGKLADGLEVDEMFQDRGLLKSIKNADISDITEFGRMVHAEMNAISDAARLGRSTQNASMYVTTFPCHNCAKHIIASGIKRLVFVEPYPKSKAKDIYSYAISDEKGNRAKIVMEHFSGIAPRRFKDIFEKGKRRDDSGKISEWYQDTCTPRIAQPPIRPDEAEISALAQNFR